MMYGKWLGLSLDTRNKIAEIFGIIKKGPTEVFSNEIKNDGYFVQDIEAALTLEAMRNFVGANSDVENRDILADMVIKKIEGPVVIASGTFSNIEVMPQEEVMKVKMPVKKAIKKVEVKKVAKKVTKKNAKK